MYLLYNLFRDFEEEKKKSMKNLKNVKFVSKFKEVRSKFRWFLFTEMQDFKLTSGYIDFICPDSRKKTTNHVEELKKLVEESLIREFSPKIRDFKSFSVMVDNIMYQIQKNSLELDK